MVWRERGIRGRDLRGRFRTNLRNIYIHSGTCSCIIELYEKLHTFADFFPNLDFSEDFLYI